MIWSLGMRDVVVEGMRSEHISDFAAIHQECFTRGWTASEFIHLLESDTVRGLQARRPANLFLPASIRPRGFVLTRIADDEAEILTIAVSPTARRFGIAKALMMAVLNDLYADRIAHLFLEVDETNDAALNLYKRLGFKKVGERQAYYATENAEKGDAPRRCALVLRRDVG